MAICCATAPSVPETETPCLIVRGKPRDMTHANLTGLPALAIAVVLVLPDEHNPGQAGPVTTRSSVQESKVQASNELETKSPPTRLHDSTAHFPPPVAQQKRTFPHSLNPERVFAVWGKPIGGPTATHHSTASIQPQPIPDRSDLTTDIPPKPKTRPAAAKLQSASTKEKNPPCSVSQLSIRVSATGKDGITCIMSQKSQGRRRVREKRAP